MLHRTETSLSFPKLLVEQSDPQLPFNKRSKAFTYELVMGTLRRRGTLDWALEKACDRPLSDLTPWIRNILRLGLYQILYLGGVPKSAAVDESVKLAKKYGHAGTAGLVNAVLRNSNRKKFLSELDSLEETGAADLAAKHSHPEWMVERLIEDWGRNRAIEIMEADNVIAPLTARANTLRITMDDLVQELVREGINAEPHPHAPEALVLEGVSNPPGLEAYKKGLLYYQDASSMLAARCLDVEPGMNVLDVCAGPGGKSTHLAELMSNTGRVFALDLHEHRVELIKENARRLGADIVDARTGDATKDISGEYCAMDRVIADVPCSGIGVIRRRVDLKWRLKPERIGELARLQSKILEGASACVKPGGILLYCTCTITHEENSGVVNGFLRRHGNFEPDASLPKEMEKYVTEEGFAQILPGEENMDGFFVARLRRL